MIALLIGGIVVLCVGLLTVAFGIPIKEFSFGNTLILAGTGAAGAGLVLIGLYMVGREVRTLVRHLERGSRLPVPASAVPPLMPPRELEVGLTPMPSRQAETSPVPELPQALRPVRPRPISDAPLFTRDLPARDQPRDPAPARGDFADALASSLDLDSEAPPRSEEPVIRPHNPEPAEAPPELESAPRSRRNIMFASHRRSPRPEPDFKEASLREASQPGPEADEAPPASGDAPGEPEADQERAVGSSWRERSAAQRRRRDSLFPPREPSEALPSEPSPEPLPPPPEVGSNAVTVVKSGVVDSMAYSLYSDGSIEAQMPEGMVRFASIDELRAHLERR
ncbi:MAG: hypothetical protein J0G37_15075 [Afipia sp.]|nr:hypothetical protein [Afipia sp.]